MQISESIVKQLANSFLIQECKLQNYQLCLIYETQASNLLTQQYRFMYHKIVNRLPQKLKLRYIRDLKRVMNIRDIDEKLLRTLEFYTKIEKAIVKA